MDTAQSVLKSAKSFFAGTLLSRLSGLFREIALAVSFGTSPEIAAFMVSYRLANLFRRLLGEGNLQAGFVPHFATLKEEGGRFFRDVAYSMAILLLLIVAFFEGILWGLRAMVSPDWLSIIDLTMWMMPGLFFICLYGLNAAVLQCQKKFFLPAVAPVAFNFVWIASVWIYPDVTFLAMGVTLAFAGQWLITAFESFRLLPLKEWFKPHLFSLEFRKLLKPLFLGIIGIGAVQFNSALDTIFARLADLRGPTYLWYAIRIQQLPIALFGVALSGALLPPLSRAVDSIQRNELLQTALRQGTALMLICTFGILALGKEGVNLLYGHGAFSAADVLETARCLLGYGLGLVPTILVLILAAKHYAEKNYRTPTLASLISVAVNVGLNALFVFGFHLGALSIALATSLSALVNVLCLSRGAFERSYWVFFSKMSLACSMAAIAVKAAASSLILPQHLLGQVVQCASLGGLFFIVLGAFAFLLRLRFLPQALQK